MFQDGLPRTELTEERTRACVELLGTSLEGYAPSGRKLLGALDIGEYIEAMWRRIKELEGAQ